MHGLDRADVQAARRLRDDEDERVVLELAAEHELLQVAAGEVPHGRRRPGRLHVVALDDPRARRRASAEERGAGLASRSASGTSS